MASQNRDLKVKGHCDMKNVIIKMCLLLLQVMTNKMGNPEAEKRAEYYDQHWTKEAVTRYFYTKVYFVRLIDLLNAFN